MGNGNGEGYGNRYKWFDPKISFGNVLAMAAFLVSAVFAWSRIDSHLNDAQRHQTILEKQHMMREQIDLMDAPVKQDIAEINRKLDAIANKLDRLAERR